MIVKDVVSYELPPENGSYTVYLKYWGRLSYHYIRW